ncbi:hypothetical protein RF11_10992 [Thelohanellus kitauei]|uniref:Uncharacterized protein n=1 Tax=Thelohanellus kitauei TaxID=669202 RepID=A0A0C2M9R4_THEKT|nr:hypothetical protein RF11_10992 [Thelohanellus kitauei]
MIEGTGFTESVSQADTEPTLEPHLSEYTPRDINSKTSPQQREKSLPVITQIKQPLLVETSNKQDEDLKRNTPIDELNVERFFKKPNYADRSEMSLGMGTDRNFVMNTNINIELQEGKEGKFEKK